MTPPFRTASLLIFAAMLCTGQDVGGVPPAPAAPAAENSANPPAAPATTAEPAGGAAGQPAPAVAPKPEAAAAEKPPAPNAAAAPGAGKAYVLGPNDVVEIKVWNDQKFNSFYTVGPDGTISVPLIGDIKADGLTVGDLMNTIRTKLGDFINEPEVNVQVAKMNSKKYFIYGGVGHPGEFALTEQTTIMDAFANSGGFRDFANTKKIYILRGTQKFNFNYKDVSHGKHMEQNIVLQNGDRIFVPE